ncbi:amidohydrolase family protein [bacterium]|nr:amidohydrolase family protein [bacterium]
MKKSRFLDALLVVSLATGLAGQSTTRRNLEFDNGQWFNGQSFERKTVYSVDGLLSENKPTRVDSTVNLEGKFVIPPFGEAHNHNIDGWPGSEDTIKRYLKDGIYYIKNPNNFPRSRNAVLEMINQPQSVDVVFANGGLTVTGGHPHGLVLRNISRGIFEKTDGEGNFLFKIDTLEDLDKKWQKIKSSNPEILKEIVRRAHGDGLRVSTHVETGSDFHHAVAAGVDEINHMPGFRPQDDILAAGRLDLYAIAEEDARLAARKQVVVVTTLGGLIRSLNKVKEYDPKADMAGQIKELTVRNLQLLSRNRVPLAIGSDSYRNTSTREALALYELGAFSNLELLKMWCENTARTIFPKRKIGRLQDGYEASFLILSGNPIENFTNTQKIEMRVKQGVFVAVE